jgi:hypothetical protein
MFTVTGEVVRGLPPSRRSDTLKGQKRKSRVGGSLANELRKLRGNRNQVADGGWSDVLVGGLVEWTCIRQDGAGRNEMGWMNVMDRWNGLAPRLFGRLAYLMKKKKEAVDVVDVLCM